jgi:ferric-dicitrate binding protein FerR (iron transport regulator)
MDTDPQYKTDLFRNYLQGNLSEEEELRLAEWLSISDQNYLEFKKYLSENRLFQSHSNETNQAWQNTRRKIYTHFKYQVGKTAIIPDWLKIAAIIVVALVAGFYSNRIIQPDGNRQATVNEIIVPNGEKAQVILSDGTKVYLNAGTRFKYPAVFSQKKREVILTGEAFFEVTKKKSSPFIIETPRFNVKVTGTSFNLNTYREDAENILTLHTGEVIIACEDQEFRVQPGEKFVFNTRTGKSGITTTDLEKSILWKEGMTVIEDLNLEEIVKILERKFNVQIRIMDEKYKKIRYAGQFKAHETLVEILDLIKETSPVKFNYEINETKNVITIK